VRGSAVGVSARTVLVGMAAIRVCVDPGAVVAAVVAGGCAGGGSAETAVTQAQVAYDAARAAEVSGIQAAEQQIAQAQTDLDKLRAGADVIVNTDADNQYRAEDIPKAVEPP